MGEAPIWGRFWELGDLSPDERGLVRRARHEVRRALLAHPRIASNYSLSHADLHPENIRATIMKALFAELGVTPKQWCCADEISSLGLDVEPLEVAVARHGIDGQRDCPRISALLRGLPPHAERFPAELPLRSRARNHGQSLALRRTYQFSPQPVAIAPRRSGPNPPCPPPWRCGRRATTWINGPIATCCSR